MYIYVPHTRKPLHPPCSWSGYGPDSPVRHIHAALFSISLYLIASVTLGISHFNIKPDIGAYVSETVFH
jgi:hypothetical protein